VSKFSSMNMPFLWLAGESTGSSR